MTKFKYFVLGIAVVYALGFGYDSNYGGRMGYFDGDEYLKIADRSTTVFSDGDSSLVIPVSPFESMLLKGSAAGNADSLFREIRVIAGTEEFCRCDTITWTSSTDWQEIPYTGSRTIGGEERWHYGSGGGTSQFSKHVWNSN